MVRVLTIKQMQKQLDAGNVFEIRPHVFESFKTGKISFITRGGKEEYLRLKKRRR